MIEFERQLVLSIPPHMHESITDWVSKGEPSPDRMGKFLYALLSNDLMGAFQHADAENLAAMFHWAVFLHNYAPADCFGSVKAVDAWWKLHHPDLSDEDRGPDPMTMAKAAEETEP
jgi:hypothetical protein